MADPATIALVVKTAITAATDKRTWKAVGVIIAVILTPFILIVVMITSLLFGTAEHNNSAVQLAFHGGIISNKVPEDYRQYIKEMQSGFKKLDTAIAEIGITEGSLDSIQVKAVFYSQYFGTGSLKDIDYQAFVECFIRYEERTRTVTDDQGNESTETYTVAVPITSLTEVYTRLKNTLNLEITYENQANATEIYYRALYGTGAPNEGDEFNGWADWSPEQLAEVNDDLPVTESGVKAVKLAISRLGDPYSQALRGQDNYTDCSYLVLWVYRQLGIKLPGTAAEQARYCVSKGLTISRSSLAPGDLVFWSYGPNGRYLNITHVGIYYGDGMVVDASSSRGKVVYRKLFDADKQVLLARPCTEKKK